MLLPLMAVTALPPTGAVGLREGAKQGAAGQPGEAAQKGFSRSRPPNRHNRLRIYHLFLVRVNKKMKRSATICATLPAKILVGTRHFCTGKELGQGGASHSLRFTPGAWLTDAPSP
jgi:hypothetical protein